jgi:hypothetical protein
MSDFDTLEGARQYDETERQAEADRRFGATLREMIDAGHGSGSGARFRDLIIRPTMPGSAARKQQDKAWSLITARLSKLAGSAP